MTEVGRHGETSLTQGSSRAIFSPIGKLYDAAPEPPMSLRRLFAVSFTALILGILGLGVISVLMIANEDAMNRRHDLQYRSYRLADELRQSSDDLTRMARLFVVTHDPRYEAAYREILAIRNGVVARPLDYHRVYWDLVLDPETRPRGRGDQVPLQDLMRKAGFTSEEFALIRRAQENSDALVKTETLARNVVKGLDPEGNPLENPSDPAMPVRIMHDADYMKEKARIMGPIDSFLARVEDRTHGEVEGLVERGRLLLVANQVLVGLLLVLALGFGVMVPTAIFRQVGGEPRLVEGEVRRIADGDLTVGSSEGTTADGRGILAAMGDMAGRLRGVVTQVGGSAHQIARQSVAVDGSATELAQAAGAQAQATHEASAAMQQVVAAIQSTAKNAMQTGDLARLAAENARTSGRAVAEAVDSMREIVERVGVVGEFARKTRILSLNAAIEAARASAGGKGFAVVASEVRALAERSEEAADDIDRLVTNAMKVAERARGLIDRLVPTIEETSALIRQISDASCEQSEGAQQIQAALEQIEAVASRDSKASSELLDLARDLADQARSLDGAMAFFHLPESEAPGLAGAASPSRIANGRVYPGRSGWGA